MRWSPMIRSPSSICCLSSPRSSSAGSARDRRGRRRSDRRTRPAVDVRGRVSYFRPMSLAALLGMLEAAGAERLDFAPGEVPLAHDGDRTWPIQSEPIRSPALLEAVFEILSQDELQGIPENRPRTVRHEHEGRHYVLEVGRQAKGIRLGIRFAKPTMRKESIREAPKEPPKRAEKRTMRVDVDDEGNPLDTTTVDVDRRMSLPQQQAVKKETRPVRRPSRT